MAEHEFDQKEINAGVLQLNTAFGFYATLDAIAQHSPAESEDEITQWTYYKFYTKVSYLSHTSAYQKRLAEQYRR